MAWNPNVPQSTDYLNNFPAQQTANNGAIAAAISAEHQALGSGNDGIHAIPVLTTAPAGLPGRLAIINNVLNWFSNGAWYNNQAFASGTTMIFYQASAPTGWTQVTTVNDQMLRVVNGAGGGSGGSWTISGATVQGHALSVAEMPSHSHAFTAEQSYGNYMSITGSPGPTYCQPSSASTENTGGGSAHVHGFTNDASWRPAYINCIVASKN